MSTPHIQAILPKVFQPTAGIPLLRLGRETDGGYLIDARTLKHTDGLISLGVGDDWSFDCDFLDACPVPFVSYDGSVSHWELFVGLYRRVVMFEPINARKALRVWWRFTRFYRRPGRTHHMKYIGDSIGRNRTTLAQILDQDIPAHLQRLFLSIDIEHAEYHLLDTLIDRADRIEGLAIEIHDFDRHMDQIVDFIERFPLNIAHVHANNFGGVVPSGAPTVIEITFTRHNGDGSETHGSPHPLDVKNAHNLPEVAIEFV